MTTRILILLLSVAIPAYAEENAATKLPDYLPKELPYAAVDIGKLVIAKASPDGLAVRVIRPALKQEILTRVVTKTVMNTETRTRPSPDGKSTQSYTIQVPSTVQEQVPYVRMKIVGEERLRIPITELKATDLRGNVISVEILKNKLQNSVNAFLIETYDETPLAPLDPFYGTVLRMETLRLVVPADAIKKYTE